ncbi:MAG: ferredoxin [Actinomycetota bacterium]
MRRPRGRSENSRQGRSADHRSLCEDHCADAFKLLEDGIAYVAELGVPLNDPGGAGSMARVAPRDRQSVLRAAEVCPGECIFIDVSDEQGVPKISQVA